MKKCKHKNVRFGERKKEGKYFSTAYTVGTFESSEMFNYCEDCGDINVSLINQKKKCVHSFTAINVKEPILIKGYYTNKVIVKDEMIMMCTKCGLKNKCHYI